VAKIDRIAANVSDNLTTSLGRVGQLALGVTLLAGTIGAATWITGTFIFDEKFRLAWFTLGGLLCAVPFLSGLFGWWLVRQSRKAAPQLIDNVATFMSQTSKQTQVLLDHDTGQPLGNYTKSLGDLRSELVERRRDFPALFAGVRALTSVPGLAAVAVLGSVVLGILGTVLFIGAIID
jgi:hypothetical protein